MDWFVLVDFIVAAAATMIVKITPAIYVLAFQITYVFYGVFHEFDEATWLFKSAWLLSRFVYHSNNLEKLVVVGPDGYELTNYLWIEGFAATTIYFGTFVGQLVRYSSGNRQNNVKAY